MAVGNIADLIRNAKRSAGQAPAVFAGASMLTWAELDRAVDVGAQALHDTGAQPGDVVIIALPTTPELIVALLAAARAGLVLVPLAPQAGELTAVAQAVGAVVAVTDEPLTLSGGRLDMATVTSWLTGQAPEFAAIGGGEDVVALAGTTRAEGAVMLSHRAIMAAVTAISAIPQLPLSGTDRVLQAMPLAHVAGLVTVLLPVAAAGAAVVLPEGRDAAAVLASIDHHRVTVIPGMPLLYRALLAEPGMERALASVRLMTSGTAPLPPADLAAFRSRTGQSIYEGYGLSEGACALTSALMSPGARPGSAGRCLPGMELRICVDDTTVQDLTAPAAPTSNGPGLTDATDTAEVANVCPADTSDRPRPPLAERLAEVMPPLAEMPGVGEVGRIAIRGPQLFSGYWPEGAGGPGPEGWFVTADTGYLDDHGELHLLDRTTDTIIVSGFTVYPWEVENALASHPYVAEAAVVGWPVGPAMVALVVAEPGTRPTAADLDEHLRPLLPAYKRPGGYQVVDALPRGVMGRVDRGAALALYAANHPEDMRFVVGSAPTLAVVDAAAAMAPPTGTAGAGAAGSGMSGQPAVTALNGADLTAGTAASSAVIPADTAAEPVGDLDTLGRKLPRSGPVSSRGAQDTDEDLF